MLKVGIVGCGKIADDHASQIRRIKGCEIVGVCDREPLMARQLYERFPIKRYFSDVTELLNEAQPDVVHITTPPQSHFDVARLCLERNCHVYVEKPFTLYAEEARTLVALAERKALKMTVGHDDQFSNVARRMRSLVQSGYLGGTPVHMESYFCYDLSDPAYARALLGDKQHWVRRLPGQLLQNIISHGVARIAEFLTSDEPQVIAHGFVSPLLKSMGETELVDELRVIISEEERTTAYFTFSSQMRPSLHEFRVYGPLNGLIVDQDRELLIKLRGAKFKSYADKFIPPANLASQLLGNVRTNVRSFLGNKFHMKAGMKCLIESFYDSIVQDTPVPIPYREILLTAKIMDDIFDQLHGRTVPARENETFDTMTSPR
ncbi:MAG TPA: Gfo/Idh/MocA family oxidoreductase [Terriglobales bacterium]|jgi:predicted dehydrogenase|nr:Gfo/Idh/MocA family oxidoreductase [Terriglobales bacterium]